jgi:serine/threonine protein kinase
MDRRGKPHLIDFGLARFFEDVTLTNTGALVGTPMYMSPEQVSGRVELDHRTDIYSLGLVLYELLILQRPIAGPTREGVLRQVVTKALPPLSWRNRDVPRDLESVVHKATAKDPDDRYQSALAFAADLGNVLGNKPVAAKFYRYGFDEKDIAAERPREVIYFSFLLIFISIIIFLYTTIRMYNSVYRDELFYIFLLQSIVLSPLLLISSSYILAGRGWARMMVATIGAIISLCLCAWIAFEN